ncbi:16S rRNA (guanine(527)-N(7))-methyltransferase RsmG [Granulicella sp. 5B5]|uniref:16S rRNA (guanine(527)-N(7))-methyltransferase RsmG n=1 Tax=Granulicella sp. 5B5 TaxID=1617967 RepID=UPI0015F395A1|nr:16S rRNA (guanine(527)-N(7))-methyltransferase RsmG [Granulicella sp. 5B5]QMV18771.1 16S rRNA (guanine(527)-N(7))-methyltransferase RsmG [Granulicella sp. 5B5]
MPTLPESRLITLLAPYFGDTPAPATLYPQLSTYLDLLLKWNARTNLTAIRDPETIVQRHFGESLFTGLQLASRLSPAATLLDFGSGAGFPGLPIQLLLPELRVTLGESQNKKATFLREAIRTLALPHTEVWSARIEEMPSARRFDAVTLRAVDRMDLALIAARPRVASAGWLITLAESPSTTASDNIPLPSPSHGYITLEHCP